MTSNLQSADFEEVVLRKLTELGTWLTNLQLTVNQIDYRLDHALSEDDYEDEEDEGDTSLRVGK